MLGEGEGVGAAMGSADAAGAAGDDTSEYAPIPTMVNTRAAAPITIAVFVRGETPDRAASESPCPRMPPNTGAFPLPGGPDFAERMSGAVDVVAPVWGGGGGAGSGECFGSESSGIFTVPPRARSGGLEPRDASPPSLGSGVALGRSSMIIVPFGDVRGMRDSSAKRAGSSFSVTAIGGAPSDDGSGAPVLRTSRGAMSARLPSGIVVPANPAFESGGSDVGVGAGTGDAAELGRLAKLASTSG